MSDQPTPRSVLRGLCIDDQSADLIADRIASLQRENAALREENAEWREMIREAVFDNNDILYWIRGARSILLDAVEKDRAAYAARKEAKP